MKRNKLFSSIKYATFFGAAVIAAPLTFAEAQKDKDEAVVEEVTVTGSRIVRDNNLSQPAPIMSIDASSIQEAANLDLGSILAELPSVGATNTLIGNSRSNSSAGLSTADLRRLGSKRTLTLVDGFRHVGGNPGTTSVDLGTIPQALIERVEVVTGGASAVYGSDAVSGVVNITTRKDFEGFQLSVNGQTAAEVDSYNNNSIALLAGSMFSEGRGNITGYASLDRIAEVMNHDLQHLNGWGTIENPDDTGEDDGIPDLLAVPHIASEILGPNGVMNVGGQRWAFTDDGTPVLQAVRQGTNNSTFGYLPDCEYCLVLDDHRNFSPAVDKVTVGTLLNYDVSDSLRAFADVKYVSSDITQQFQPMYAFGSINVADNPYLNDTLRAALQEANPDRGTATVAKMFDEAGLRTAENDRDLFRFLGGLEGEFSFAGNDVNYQVFYNYGRTSNTRVTNNTLIEGNLEAALDAVIDPATGKAACRSQVASLQGDDYSDPSTFAPSNCTPYNPFGFGQVSPEAVDWAFTDTVREDTMTQVNFGGFVGFDSSNYFKLPGGPVQVVLGVEYRKEESSTTTDWVTQSGILSQAPTPDESGSFSVKEAYTEVALPILSESDLFLVDDLSLEFAYRTADYDPFGTADALKVGLMYGPIESLKFRATYGEAVRAPNINEAFSAQSPGFDNVSDPCHHTRVDNDPDRAANCAALGIPPGFEADDAASIDTISGGNPELTPEESTSYTAGFIFTPDILDDFSLTVDYYNIEITDAILSVDPQDIINNCVDGSAGLDPNFCGAVDRDPVTNDIALVRSGYINASKFTTQGVEMNMNAALEVGPGMLSTNVLVTKLLELDLYDFQNLPDVNAEAGELGDPEWQGRLRVNYAFDDFSVSWAARFLDRSARFNVSPAPYGDTPEDTAIPYIGSMTTHDFSLNYTFNENTTFNVGVRNAFNKLAHPITQNAIYDLIGRRFNAGVRVNF